MENKYGFKEVPNVEVTLEYKDGSAKNFFFDTITTFTFDNRCSTISCSFKVEALPESFFEEMTTVRQVKRAFVTAETYRRNFDTSEEEKFYLFKDLYFDTMYINYNLQASGGYACPEITFKKHLIMDAFEGDMGF